MTVQMAFGKLAWRQSSITWAREGVLRGGVEQARQPRQPSQIEHQNRSMGAACPLHWTPKAHKALCETILCWVIYEAFQNWSLTKLHFLALPLYRPLYWTPPCNHLQFRLSFLSPHISLLFSHPFITENIIDNPGPFDSIIPSTPACAFLSSSSSSTG